jgi:YrbI family 3-deoxy-D-manno-octulosonate 8-phosphate phosphatase
MKTLIKKAVDFNQVLSTVELIVFDFDGVFTDNSVYVSQEGVESVRCCRSDGLGLKRLHEFGVKTFILSTETNPVVSSRSNKMGIECIQGVENKGEEIIKICNALKISPIKTAYLGNDINDISAFMMVGVPIGVADAYDEINSHILFRLDKNGGQGAVREVCDLIYYSKKVKAINES